MLAWRKPSEPKFRPLWQRHLNGDTDNNDDNHLTFLHLSKSTPIDPEMQRRQYTRKLHQIAALFFVLLLVVAIVKESLVSFRSLLFPNSMSESTFSSSDHDAPTAAPSAQDQLITDEILNVMTIPPYLRFLANTFDPFSPTDRLVLLKISRTGTTMMEHIATRCFGQVVASIYPPPGRSDSSFASMEEINYLEVTTQKNGDKYWNVDLSTPEGIVKAKDLQLAYQPQARVLVSPHLYEVSAHLLNDQYRGRVFIMFRHPVERLVSLFYYLEKEDKLPSNTVTLQDFVKHNATSLNHNMITRQLCHKVGYGDVLTRDDEKLARRVLRDKVVIGLLSEKGESLRRLEQTFQWSVDRPKVEHCHERLMNWDWPLKNKHIALSPEKEVYKSMERRNAFDMRLYAYAHVLFRQQAVLFQVDEK
jgi:hypothetical protein